MIVCQLCGGEWNGAGVCPWCKLRSQQAAYQDMLAGSYATIADLRDRLRIMAPMVCDGCGCEARCGDRALCWDCNTARLSCVLDGWSQDSSHAAACVSVGLRTLCGRRILEGC